MIRILLLANEHPDFRQIGFRRTLSNLKNAKLIQDFQVLSPQRDLKLGLDRTTVLRNALEVVRIFKPSHILVMHPHRMQLTPLFWQSVKNMSDAKIILWEGDAYSLLRKQPSLADIATSLFSDVIFTVGKGSLANNFRLYGARNIQWIPHCFEPDRIGINKPVSEKPNFAKDVVIIANRSGHRFRPAPGWRERQSFILESQDVFGERLSLWGWGWSGPGYQGQLAFDDQFGEISRSRVSANWDHYPRAHSYFSNRLPISLASGSVHATTLHPGYETIFPSSAEEFLITSRSPSELVRKIQSFLDATSDDEVARRSILASQFAFKAFRQDDWIVKMLNHFGEIINPVAANECWLMESEL